MVNQTALLVIDVQTAMFVEAEAPYRAEEVLATIAGLQRRARAAGIPVIFVRHEDHVYAPMRPGHPGFEVHETVAPLAGESIIDKKACDSFCETGLADLLDELEITRLVVAGMQTDYCVNTSCRSALHQGYDVTLVADGHSTWDNGIITAEQIVAHHNKTLSQLPRPGSSITVIPAALIDFDPVPAYAEAALAV